MYNEQIFLFEENSFILKIFTFFFFFFESSNSKISDVIIDLSAY